MRKIDHVICERPLIVFESIANFPADANYAAVRPAVNILGWIRGSQAALRKTTSQTKVLPLTI